MEKIGNGGIEGFECPTCNQPVFNPLLEEKLEAMELADVIIEAWEELAGMHPEDAETIRLKYGF